MSDITPFICEEMSIGEEVEVRASSPQIEQEVGNPGHPDVFTLIHDSQGNLFLVPYVIQDLGEGITFQHVQTVEPTPPPPQDDNLWYVVHKKMEEPGNEVEIELEDSFKDTGSSSSSLTTVNLLECKELCSSGMSISVDHPYNRPPSPTYTTSTLFQKEEDDVENRPFLCDLCSYRAKKKYTLTVHLMTHNKGLKKFGCPYEDCKYATAFTQDLRNHIARHHTKVKGYQCGKCSYASYTSKELARHSRTHYDPKWICSFCSFKTRNPRSLKKHWERKHRNKSSSAALKSAQ